MIKSAKLLFVNTKKNKRNIDERSLNIHAWDIGTIKLD